MSLNFAGATTALITATYTYDGEEYSETLTLDRAEAEREMNRRNGADNKLSPKWVDITDHLFAQIIDRSVASLASPLIPIPIDEETPEGMDIPEGVRVLIPISNIRKVTVYIKRESN